MTNTPHSLAVIRGDVGGDGMSALTSERAAMDLAIAQLRGDRDEARAEIERLRAALQYIERWQLPASGRAWDDGRPMSFGAAFGSNGERDHMRQIAREALSSK